jgi:hypothetical protein
MTFDLIISAFDLVDIYYIIFLKQLIFDFNYLPIFLLNFNYKYKMKVGFVFVTLPLWPSSSSSSSSCPIAPIVWVVKVDEVNNHGVKL